MVELSLIVPTHNRRAWLEGKLTELEGQDLGPQHFEVLVVADGCSDGTREFLDGFKPDYAFRWFESSGLGPGKARNLAAKAAQGRVLLFSDDDVLFDPKVLRLHLEAQAQFPALYLGDLRFETGEVWKPNRRGSTIHWVSMQGNNTSLPAETFRRLGGFWEGLSGYGGEDLEFGYRLQKAGVPFRSLPQAHAVHRGGPSLGDLSKARSAGRQAMQIYQHHRDWWLGLELGVWPPLLLLKQAVFPLLKPLIGAKHADSELMFSRSAWELYAESRKPKAES